MTRPKLSTGYYHYLRLLRLGPFERRARGGWRFGTRKVADSVVDRLVASGRARIEADLVHFVEREAAR